ncbi:MAG: ScyD/ScyE family protein [Gemmatimonadaceae bacterium]
MKRVVHGAVALLTRGGALLALAAACTESPRLTAPIAPDAAAAHASVAAAAQQTVIASGLLYPRGITFDQKGALYVAEAGSPQGNTISTVGLCTQVVAPVGPWLGGATGRISRIEGVTRTTVASGLPSSLNQFGDVEGVADLAFVGPKLYAIIAVGCSRGLAQTPAGVYRIDGGAWSLAANISAWVRANPVANPEPDDFEPDGDAYSMVAAGGVLYVGEANSGNLLAIKPNSGSIARVADVSATQGHVVPTAVAILRDEILFGELTPFPSVPGAAQVLRYSRHGALLGAIGGFTAILGVETDKHGNIYVLESFTCPTTTPCFPSPGSGRVTRVAHDGTRTVIATGLSFATSMRMGPDGALYVSNFGFGPPGKGEIVRITF